MLKKVFTWHHLIQNTSCTFIASIAYSSQRFHHDDDHDDRDDDHDDDHDHHADHDVEHDFHVHVRLQYGFRGRVQRGHDVHVHRDHGCHGDLRDHVLRVCGCHGDDHVLHDRGFHVHVLLHYDVGHVHVSSR